MHATITNLDKLLQNPGAGYEQVINGSTPYSRVKALHAQASARIRHMQITRYNELRVPAADLMEEDIEDARDVLAGIRELKQDLKRGLVEPGEVMARVAASMRGVDEFVSHAQVIARDEEAATAMIDLPPGEYEQTLLERFPLMAEQGTPLVTEAYLRGEEDSPFLKDGA